MKTLITISKSFLEKIGIIFASQLNGSTNHESSLDLCIGGIG